MIDNSDKPPTHTFLELLHLYTRVHVCAIINALYPQRAQSCVYMALAVRLSLGNRHAIIIIILILIMNIEYRESYNNIVKFVMYTQLSINV